MSIPGERLAPAAEVAEHALAAAGGGDCVVVVHERSDADVRFANNTTTTNGCRRDRRVTVVRFVERDGGVAVGVASRSGGGDVAELVRAAEADAAEAAPAEDAAPLIGAGGDDPSFGDEPALTGMEVFSGVLEELGEAFGRARSEGRVLAGFATHEVATTYLATSTGIRRRHAQPTGSLELVARSPDGSRSAWAGAGTPDFSDVSLASMEGRLVERLGWSERRIDLPAGRYETILPPDAVADLVIVLAEAASGRDAEDGRSVFSAPGGGTRIGERLFEQPFNLWSDPAAPGLECASFLVTEASGADVSVFDNGAATGPLRWVDDGRLERLRYHRAGAARSGAEFTPPVDNLLLALPGAEISLDDLVRSTERGLLLTCLWYIREVDLATLLLTGLTRDGVFLVERGEVVGAVNNFRFNESPVDVLARTVEAGRPERALSREWGEWMNRTRMPPLRVADFNMSSVSPAS